MGGLLGEILLVCSALQQTYDKNQLSYKTITPDMFTNLLAALFESDLGPLHITINGELPDEESDQVFWVKRNLRQVGLKFVIEEL